ncbi:phosphatase PAP2 family protein [Ramlibacter ginsenosidimutans]|uniref:Phosphatase PAP2 family protein n=1 Tax=Ramlibacter ginsenosidimutans TaxID=502333 RepID=A0A934TRZ6_9BURK|nr:phosphatase PAP2 family protein [Ramlibacter ginsenosidimutans]MBK6006238.1 phosphatase PAP2 family protein [Ramlibacter ginsenosidimutans]
MAASDPATPALRPARGSPLLWAVALLCLLLLATLAGQVLLHGRVPGWDDAVSLHYAQHRAPALTSFMLWVSRLHQTVVVLAVTAVLALAIGLRFSRSAVRPLLIVPAGMLLNVVLKNLVQRPRPHWDHALVSLPTWSFPSGHALAATVFYGTVCALVFAHTRSRGWRALAVLLVVVMVPLVCFSRVYLGAHYPSDVVAGVAEGTLCVLLGLGLLRQR